MRQSGWGRERWGGGCGGSIRAQRRRRGRSWRRRMLFYLWAASFARIVQVGHGSADPDDVRVGQDRLLLQRLRRWIDVRPRDVCRHFVIVGAVASHLWRRFCWRWRRRWISRRATSRHCDDGRCDGRRRRRHRAGRRHRFWRNLESVVGCTLKASHKSRKKKLFWRFITLQKP